MSAAPFVSVITIFLNAERFLAEATASVCAQTWQHWELLLVNDGSTDGSRERALQSEAAAPGRVRFLEHDNGRNRGMSASRNLGLRHARGELVTFLDADDVWLPGKLEEQVALLEQHPRAAMVFGASQYWHGWSGRSEDQARDHVPALGVEADRLFEAGELQPLLYPLGRGTAPCPSDLLIRRAAIDRAGGFEDDVRTLYEDQYFLAKIYATAPVWVAGSTWTQYRIHPSSSMSEALEAAHYHRVRLRFLNWLEVYLTELGRRGTPAWLALQDALWSYRHPDSGRSRWWLRDAAGNKAVLTFFPREPQRVRIEVTAYVEAAIYDIQLNRSGFDVQQGEHYVVRFEARSDRVRSMTVGCARSEEPWTGLGLYAALEVDDAWRSFAVPFIATHDEPNARILFDLGGDSAAVDVREVGLSAQTEALEPSITPRPATVEPLAAEPDRSVESSRPPTERPAADQGVQPVSLDWGWDRGLPIDRHYIHDFLGGHAKDICGHVLEVGDRVYTERFGQRVTASDVLDVSAGNRRATILADLSEGELPDARFDCIILTQTLQYVRNPSAALETLRRSLKPGGTLLATLPAISRVRHDDPDGVWFGLFTSASARRLFAAVFGMGSIDIRSYGNVRAATAWLYGLAADELTLDELDYFDVDYPVVVTVRAVRTSLSDAATSERAPVDPTPRD